MPAPEDARLEVERLWAELLELERLEAERLEAERLEWERLEAERLEAERVERELLEAERLEAERRARRRWFAGPPTAPPDVSSELINTVLLKRIRSYSYGGRGGESAEIRALIHRDSNGLPYRHRLWNRSGDRRHHRRNGG